MDAEPRQSGVTDWERGELNQFVVDFLGPYKARLWWITASPAFGGFSPAALLAVGREETVYDFIREAKENEECRASLACTTVH